MVLNGNQSTTQNRSLTTNKIAHRLEDEHTTAINAAVLKTTAVLERRVMASGNSASSVPSATLPLAFVRLPRLKRLFPVPMFLAVNKLPFVQGPNCRVA
jgi:hypothetical protein